MRRTPSRHQLPPEAAPPSLDDDLRAAATAMFSDATRIEPVAGSANLARVETPGGSWCVRRWPVETPVERIVFAHKGLSAARAAGLSIVPAPFTLDREDDDALRLGSRLYDAVQWLPGRSLLRGSAPRARDGRSVDLPGSAPPSMVAEVVAAVARWHEATAVLTTEQHPPAAPLDAVRRAVWSAWSAQREVLRPIAPRTPHVQRWLRSGEQVLPAVEHALDTVENLRARPPVVAHLSLWPAHILTMRQAGNEQVTGLLDYSQIAVGSPLLDLAHIANRFGVWRPDTAETILGAYTGVRQLAPDERRLLPVIAALDLVAETGRVLSLAFGRGRVDDDAGAEMVRAAAAALLQSLETLAPVVHRHEAPIRPFARKWVHRPRPVVRRNADGPKRPPKRPADRPNR